jgi:hypothetical protein
MTDEQRRFMHATHKVRAKFLNPITELLGAAADLVAGEKQRADQAVTTLEVLRPVWAQGWTSDGQAAQASATALAEIWKELGVDNQTEAMIRIRELLA